MSVEEHEQLRATIWDHIYHSGPQSLKQLSEHMHLDIATVMSLVAHEWFSVRDELVRIATEGE